MAPTATPQVLQFIMMVEAWSQSLQGVEMAAARIETCGASETWLMAMPSLCRVMPGALNSSVGMEAEMVLEMGHS